MTMSELLFTLGQPKAHAVVHGLVAVYDEIFVNRIRCYLLMGSYADGSNVGVSDLDLVVVFKVAIQAQELKLFRSITHSLAKISPILLDCSSTDEQTLTKGIKASLKMATLLYGDAILDQYPLEPLDLHIQRSIFLAVRALYVLHGQPKRLVFPVSYPDTSSEFYGYERWGGYLGDNTFVPGLRLFVTATTMMATTLVAMASQNQAGSKKQALVLYREHVRDVWTEFLEESYRLCKTEWHYEVPQAPIARMMLRLLCERMLAFENHFLKACQQATCNNATNSDENIRHFAVETLNRIDYSMKP